MQDVFPTNQELNEMLGAEKYKVWAAVCNLIESLYEVEILRKNTNWNNWKYEHKYRRGGKTLCTLYANEKGFMIQIVLEKRSEPNLRMSNIFTRMKSKASIIIQRHIMTVNGCLSNRPVHYLKIFRGYYISKENQIKTSNSSIGFWIWAAIYCDKVEYRHT